MSGAPAAVAPVHLYSTMLMVRTFLAIDRNGHARLKQDGTSSALPARRPQFATEVLGERDDV